MSLYELTKLSKKKIAALLGLGNRVTVIENTTYRKEEVDALSTNVRTLMGEIDGSTEPDYPSGEVGDSYIISVAGKVGGAAGKVVAINDELVCITDNAGGDEATVGTSWIVLSGAAKYFATTNYEVVAGTDTQEDATPISTKYARISDIGAGSSVVLVTLTEGDLRLLVNDAGTIIYVYPPVGEEINQLGVDNPYTLTVAARRNFFKFENGKWLT